MVSIPQRSHDNTFIHYSKSIMMISDEYIGALEHTQERQEEVA